jgi:hypothetical protein
MCDLLLAIFTGLLALFTLLLAIFTGRGIVHLKRTERAYVSGGGYLPEVAPKQKGDEFGLRIDNYGKTPAFVTHVVIGYWDTKRGSPPEGFPGGTPYDLFYNIPPGQISLKTDVRIPRSEITGDIIFGRFFYEDIFSRRWIIRKKVRRSGFILRIDENNVVWPYRAPRIYTDRT